MVLEVLSAVGVMAFGAVSLVVGARLLLLGSRTHAVPELAIGTGFVVGVLFGFIPETLAYSTELIPTAWELPLIRVAELSIRLCAIAILIFTWRVFRPRAGYALAIVVTLTALLAVSHLLVPHGWHHAQGETELAWATSAYWGRTAALLWGTFESLRYWATSRKRLALGLADPFITNRFLLWSIALGAASFIMGSVLIAPLLGFTATEQSWLLTASAFGSVAAGAIWLTFFPPRAYRTWLLSSDSHS